MESLHNFRYTPLEVMSMALIVAIVCIGIPGNAFVIYVFGWRKKTKMNMKERGRRDRNRFEFLLLLLSCIDLISLLLVPPIFFYLTMAKFKVWHFGKVACKIVPSLLQITISLSQGMLVLICYERYSAIVNPFTNKRISKFRIFAWLCNVFFVSVVFIYPYAYAFEIQMIGEWSKHSYPPTTATITFLGRITSSRTMRLTPLSHSESLQRRINQTTRIPLIAAAKNHSYLSCEPVSDRWNYLFTSACLQVCRDLASAITMAILSQQMHKALVKPNGKIVVCHRQKKTHNVFVKPNVAGNVIDDSQKTQHKSLVTKGDREIVMGDMQHTSERPNVVGNSNRVIHDSQRTWHKSLMKSNVEIVLDCKHEEATDEPLVRNFEEIGCQATVQQPSVKSCQSATELTRTTRTQAEEISTSTWDRARMSSKSRKIIRTVVVVFTVLCLPVDLFHLVYYIMIKTGIHVSPIVDSVIHPMNTVLNVLQISNSAANVFIYSKMHVFVRKMMTRKRRTYSAHSSDSNVFTKGRRRLFGRKQ